MREAVALSPEPLACNQIHLNPFIAQDETRPVCGELGLVVTAYSPIAQGSVEKNAALRTIGARYVRSAAQVTLRWLVQQGIVAIPRTSKLERLSENLAIFDFALSEADMVAISALAEQNA